MKLEILKQQMIQSKWDKKTLEIAIRAKFVCEYCGCDFYSSVNNYESMQIDHIIPTKHGGDDSLSNLALTCKTCNFIKRNWNPTKNNIENITRENLINITRDYLLGKRKLKEQRILLEKDIVSKILNTIK